AHKRSDARDPWKTILPGPGTQTLDPAQRSRIPSRGNYFGSTKPCSLLCLLRRDRWYRLELTSRLRRRNGEPLSSCRLTYVVPPHTLSIRAASWAADRMPGRHTSWLDPQTRVFSLRSSHAAYRVYQNPSI